MRWRTRTLPNNGDLRTVRWFLLFPKTIDNETRWLEMASWVEQYEVSTRPGTLDTWEPVKWSN